MTGKQARGIAISAWWVLVIIVPICTLVLWIALEHTNAAQDRQNAHSDAQFAKALIVTDRKFRQALKIQTALFSYSTNRSVCGWRALLKPTLSDDRLPAARRSQIEAFLSTQVTVPSTFNCSTLPKNPPKAKPA